MQPEAQSNEGGRISYPGMSFSERVLHRLLSLAFKRRDIVIDGHLYLRRWYLKGRGTGSQWFLHNIRRPDAGRELHDHPWDFMTHILSGGYVEEILDEGEMPRLPGEVLQHEAEHTHRIAHVWPGTWTFVHAGPARRVWGFTDGNRFQPWREYLGTPDASDWPEDRLA